MIISWGNEFRRSIIRTNEGIVCDMTVPVKSCGRIILQWAGGEIEYTQGLGPCAARRVGSSPTPPTKRETKSVSDWFSQMEWAAGRGCFALDTEYPLGVLCVV